MVVVMQGLVYILIFLPGSRRWTFGIHLESCINNDAILGRVTPQPPGGARKSTEEGVAGGGRLLDALSLSVNPGFHGGGGGTWAPDGQTLQVPYVVRTCFSHLKEHGELIITTSIIIHMIPHDCKN